MPNSPMNAARMLWGAAFIAFHVVFRAFSDPWLPSLPTEVGKAEKYRYTIPLRLLSGFDCSDFDAHNRGRHVVHFIHSRAKLVNDCF
jgi:hypothetical protein